MNQYNFDEIIDRTGTDCLKWDDNGSPDIHPCLLYTSHHVGQ